jgi:hypothetical protein
MLALLRPKLSLNLRRTLIMMVYNAELRLTCLWSKRIRSFTETYLGIYRSVSGLWHHHHVGFFAVEIQVYTNNERI